MMNRLQGTLTELPKCTPFSEETWQECKELDGTCKWTPGKIPKRSVDKYLRFVNHLFESSYGTFCEEQALLFLHHCNYDVEAATNLLQPWHPTEDDAEEEVAERYEGDDFCFLCRDGGDLILCDYPECKKVYHPACLELDQVPDGRWDCPYHHCVTCQVPTTLNENCCAHCTTSYCPKCLPRQLKVDVVFGFLCQTCIERENSSAGGLPSWWLRRVVKLLLQLNKPLQVIPVVNKRELDLCSLYREVVKRGGIYKVVNNTGWAEIRRKMKLPSTANQTLRNFYMDILYPYEKRFFAGSICMESEEDNLVIGQHGASSINIMRNTTTVKRAPSIVSSSSNNKQLFARHRRAEERDQRRLEREKKGESTQGVLQGPQGSTRAKAKAERSRRYLQRTQTHTQDSEPTDREGDSKLKKSGKTESGESDTDKASKGHKRLRVGKTRSKQSADTRTGHRKVPRIKQNEIPTQTFDVLVTEQFSDGYRIEMASGRGENTRHGIVFFPPVASHDAQNGGVG